MKIVGVHISADGLRAVLLNTAVKKFSEPMETLFLPISLDLNEERKEIELCLQLKELQRKYPPHQHFFVFSIPGEHITERSLTFPFKEKFKILKALPYEIEPLLPIPLEHIVYGSKISYRTDTYAKVLAYVADKKWVSDFLNLVKKSGLEEPYIITPESSSLANLFEDYDSPPLNLKNSSIAPADQIKIFLSYKSSLSLVFSKNHAIESYNLHWGAWPLIQNIADKFRQSNDQALKYFHENAFITKEDSLDASQTTSLLKIMKKSASELTRQIRLMMLHARKGAVFKEIIIFGPAANIQNLPAYLSNIFEIPVKRLTSYKRFHVPLEYLPALGTALEGLKKPQNPPVNFMTHFRSDAYRMIKFSKVKQARLKSLALIFCVFLIYAFIRDFQSSKLQDSAGQIFSSQARKTARLKTREISVSNVKKFLKKKKKSSKAQQLFGSIPQMPFAMKKLEKITRAVENPELWSLELTELDIQGSKVTMSGFIAETYLKTLKKNLNSIAGGKKITDSTKKSKPSIAKKHPEKTQSPADSPPEQSLLVFFHFTFEMDS